MPTYVKGPQVEQNVIRFKNLLRQAEKELVEWGLREPEAKEFLAPVRVMLEQSSFWQNPVSYTHLRAHET